MLRVCIVEDESYIRAGLKMFISDLPDTCVVADYASAEEAYKHILSDQPDLVITDIVMKDMTGVDLIAKCRKDKLPYEFIFLSGYSEFEYAKAAIKYEVSEYIEKPIDHDELRNAINKVREKLHRTQELFLREINSFISGKYSEKVAAYFGDANLRVLKINFCVEDRDMLSIRDVKKAVIINSRLICGNMFAYSSFHSLVSCILAEESVTPERLGGFAKDLRYRLSMPGAVLGISSIGRISELHRLEKEADFAMMHGCLALKKQVFFDELGSLSQVNSTAYYINEFYDAEPLLRSTDISVIKDALTIAIDRLSASAPTFSLYEFSLKCVDYISTFSNKTELERVRQMILSSYSIDVLRDRLFAILANNITTARDRYDEKCDYEMEKAINYIKFNYMKKDISQKMLAQKMYFNPDYFSRKFKTVTGKKYSEYITELRINKAKELLTRGNYPIIKIADMVGYQTVRYFSKVFTKCVGMMPREYRKKILNKKCP